MIEETGVYYDFLDRKSRAGPCSARAQRRLITYAPPPGPCHLELENAEGTQAHSIGDRLFVRQPKNMHCFRWRSMNKSAMEPRRLGRNPDSF